MKPTRQTAGRSSLLVLAASLLSSWPAVAPAQKPPDPGLGYLYPPVVQAGRTSEVVIAGNDWTPDTQFLVHDRRITLTPLGRPGPMLVPEAPFVIGPKAYNPPPIPREQRARLGVPADFPPGPVYWQVANANGASRAGVFFVVDRPDLVEPPDRTAPIALGSLPVTVSARLRRHEEIDRYTFTATADGPVTFTLWARRIGSNFRGVLEVRDDGGRLLADRADTAGRDLAVTVPVERGRGYTVAVRELDFRGHRSYVYRLQVRRGPRVLVTIPAALKRGTPARFSLLLDTGAGVTRTRLIEFFPSDNAPFSRPPLFPGLFSNVRETTEEQLRAAAGKTDVLAVPTRPLGVTGQLSGPDESDRYSFRGKKGERVSIEVFAARLGGGLDVSLTLRAPDGKVLGTSDDLPGTTDAGLAVVLPAEGSYTVTLRDLAGRSAAGHRVYRLVIGEDPRGYEVSAGQLVKVRLGGSVELPVTARRRGGFDRPIVLEVAGLPEGVTVVSGSEIPAGKTATKLKFQVAADSATLARMIRITATARVGEQEVRRPVRVPAGVNLAPQRPSDDQITGILLAIVMKPRTRIRPVESDERTVHRGSTHPAPIRVERLEGYKGDVLIQLDGTQPAKFRQGLPAPDVILPAGQDVVFVPCYVPRMAETLDAYRVAMVAVTPVKDPTGRVRYLLAKMNPNTSVAITVEGGLMSLARQGEEPIAVDPARPFVLPVKLFRSAKLKEPAVLEVVFPGPLQSRFRAGSLTVTRSGQIEILVSPAGTARVRGRHVLTVRALARQPFPMPRFDEKAGVTPLPPNFLAILKSGHLPVIAEVQVPVDFGP